MSKKKKFDAVKYNQLRLKQSEIKFDIPKWIYAVMFKHTNGWTFLCFKPTVAEAQAYIHGNNPQDFTFAYRIVPCKLSPTYKLPTKFNH